ncbi:MAG: hypothetical protein J1E64_13715 [Acetatifactor sp.]|nr:hypothetical protein [Acetatifactor sp.]
MLFETKSARKKREEEAQREHEDILQHRIEWLSKDNVKATDIFFYRELLDELAPYLFPSMEPHEARTRMKRAYNKYKRRKQAGFDEKVGGDYEDDRREM